LPVGGFFVSGVVMPFDVGAARYGATAAFAAATPGLAAAVVFELLLVLLELLLLLELLPQPAATRATRVAATAAAGTHPRVTLGVRLLVKRILHSLCWSFPRATIPNDWSVWKPKPVLGLLGCYPNDWLA
jgi:hypothetical protein